MEVLIVTKPTNFEQYGDLVRSMLRRGPSHSDLLAELEQAHREHYSCLNSLKSELDAAGIHYDEVARSSLPELTKPYAGVFTVGGDGTLLSASRLVKDRSPVIGVRSSTASVGFLCAIAAPQVKQAVNLFKANQLKFEETARLMATIHSAADGQVTTTVPVLNDFLFANTNPAATTRYRIAHGEKFEIQKSSGVWISTPVGSTAAILAAGGKTMDRSDRRFQFVVRELYRGEGLPFQLVYGFFNPDHMAFSIENRSENALLALDGQRETIPLRYADRLEFKRAPSLLIAKAV